tara:strand:+ start:219 stop:755 length:537 start_codon:yes stop_codon:yes gene_type:complete
MKIKEATMKGLFKIGVIISMLGMLGACSTMTEVVERENYAEPKWYANCAESGTEGFFWWKEEYAFACGGGQSKFFQGAEEQMYAIAMNQFAKRINGVINSETTIDIVDNNRTTRSIISYKVDNVAIREHIAHERMKFKYQGEYYTFVKLKMNKEVFDMLLQEAKNAHIASNQSRNSTN